MTKYINEETLRKLMYEEAFEKDSDMQKWDSGCWIRYKLFENCLEAVPAEDVKEIKHGRWQFEIYENMPWCTKAICTSCKQVVANNEDLTQTWGKDLFLRDNLYCSRCGAVMDGGYD